MNPGEQARGPTDRRSRGPASHTLHHESHSTALRYCFLEISYYYYMSTTVGGKRTKRNFQKERQN